MLSFVVDPNKNLAAIDRAFRPFYYADVRGFFHDFDQLAECPR